MRRRLVSTSSLVLLLSAACATYGFPPAFIPRTPTASDWPDAGAVVLEDVATLTFRTMELAGARGPRLVVVLDVRRRIKVLADNGLRFADVTLPIDGYTSVTRAVARSVWPDVSEQLMPNSALTVTPRPEAAAPEVKLLQFHVPDAVVGGLIEYRYERVYTDPYLVPPYLFAAELPVLRSELSVVVPTELKVDYRMGRGDEVLDRGPLRHTQSDGLDRLLFVETDLPALFSEPLAPDATRYARWLAVALRAQPKGDKIERLDTWDAVARQVSARLRRASITEAAHGTAQERYHALQGRLQAIDLLGLGVRSPQDAAALQSGAPACSRDAAALLQAQLEGSGSKSGVALLTGPLAPPAQHDFPALYPFSRAVVAVELGAAMLPKKSDCRGEVASRAAFCGLEAGSVVYLDPLCRTCAFGTVAPALRGGHALWVAPGAARWLDAPPAAPETNVRHQVVNWKMDVDGSLDGTLLVTARGYQAAELRRALGSGEPNTAAVTPLLLGADSNARVSGLKAEALTELDAPLSLHATLGGMAVRREVEHFRLRPMDIAGSSVPETWRGSRRTPAVLDAPFWLETDVEVQLPTGYEAEQRPPLRIVSDHFEYAAGFSLHGRTLHFLRRFVVKTQVILPKDWEGFVEALTEVRNFEREGPRVWTSD